MSTSFPIEKTTEETLVMAILELSGILHKRGANVTADTGITTQQWLLLLHLAQDPNIPNLCEKGHHESREGWLASELATAMHVSRPYITNLVNTLLERKLIHSISDSKDMRKKLLTLTVKGEEAIKALQPHRKQANMRLFDGLLLEDREEMLKGLHRCLSNLKVPLVRPKEEDYL